MAVGKLVACCRKLSTSQLVYGGIWLVRDSCWRSRRLKSHLIENEKGKMWGWFSEWTHDRAESQLHKEGDRQASIRDLANQGSIRAGVRLGSSYHKEANQHAW